MKDYEIKNLRNVALIGHGASGKTSLAQAILFDTGAVNRLGKVEEGNTVTDYDPEEIERGISISTALCLTEWENHKITIIDTPGYANFISDAYTGIRVADSAILLICGVAGVEVQTEKVWKFAAERELPRIIVINKLDRERASFTRALESAEKRFGRGVVPIALPIGEEKGFRGIIDLIEKKGYIYAEDDSGKFEEKEIPKELGSIVEEKRERLIEMVAEMDDELMERFFDAGTLTEEELTKGLKKAVLSGKLFPVLPLSAARNIGVHRLISAVIEFTPSPAERGEVKGKNQKDGSEMRRLQSPDEPYSAFVFKTMADPFTGKITLFRVYSGMIKSDSTIYNVTKKKTEKLGSLFFLQGKSQLLTETVKAGELAGVAKLKETATNDTLADQNAPIVYPPISFLKPSISFAIKPKTRGDEEKISSALNKLLEEDQTFTLDRHSETKELIISGQGQLHVEVIIAKLKKKFGVEVILAQPKVPYRETITTKAKAQGKYKKQTGGRGQYGDCWIEIEPLPRGEEFEFVDKIFGGAIPKNFIPAIQKGIREAKNTGVLAGYPVVDFRVILFDGTYHTVDSSELAFKIAGSLAFKKAMEQAKPVLLEPIMNVEITVPDDSLGDAMGDLNSRRGRIMGVEAKGGYQDIKVQVPMAEMLSYVQDLNSLTGGRGSFEMEFSHYDEVPGQIAQKIIEEAKKTAEGEEKE
jgi:elongation factor G